MAPRTRQRRQRQRRPRHDRLFRLIFSNTKEAAAFLRARLPVALAGRFRWSTCAKFLARSSIRSCAASSPTLLFEVRTNAGGGAAGRQWLCLLFEHQSRPDRRMAMRMMSYCCRIWEATRDSHPKERFLRPVLPVVFYQGKRPWRYAQELAESFPPGYRGES